MFKLPGNTIGKRAFLKGNIVENFEQFEKQYKPMIWSIIHSLHIYKNQEEFYQTGLIALWQAHLRFDETKGSFISYAYSYIRGKILTELTVRKKCEDVSVTPKEEFWELIEDENGQQPLEKENVLSYCTRLTDNQKKWVLYTALADMSIKEIAEFENVSMSAVKAWRKGARDKLIGTIKL